jgi:hypothetical protein
LADETTLAEPSDISTISIVDEMKTSYLDYAMSVIVARALPDVRDGLKPVHRRISIRPPRTASSRASRIASRRASSATSWVNITRTATARSMTRWRA